MVKDSGNILLRLHRDINNYIFELEEKTNEKLKRIKSDKGEENKEAKNLLVAYISLLELKGTLDILTSMEAVTIKTKIRRAEELINYHLIVNKKKEKRREVSDLINNQITIERNNRVEYK